MSSFIGHSLATVTVAIGTRTIAQLLFLANYLKSFLSNWHRFAWLLWLIVIACIPDLDYLVVAWQSSNNNGLRITHSVLFSLIAPSATIAILALIKIKGLIKGKTLWLLSLQTILAGLSHLALDLAVGVTPLALFYPVINLPIKLPFSILPSAGKINLDNYYFYRNLRLEMGVLLPLLILVCV